MHIEELTLGQIQQLVQSLLATETRREIKTCTSHVIVRTFSAGVHFGDIVERKGREVLLRNARRIWSWNGGRLSLSEIAVQGVIEARISVAVPSILLTEAIEIIEPTHAAWENLQAVPPWKP